MKKNGLVSLQFHNMVVGIHLSCTLALGAKKLAMDPFFDDGEEYFVRLDVDPLVGESFRLRFPATTVIFATGVVCIVLMGGEDG